MVAFPRNPITIPPMAQHNNVLNPQPHYTRADFIALRAWLNRLPITLIAERYYIEDDLVALNCPTVGDLQARLENLRDGLIQRALDHNPTTRTPPRGCAPPAGCINGPKPPSISSRRPAKPSAANRNRTIRCRPGSCRALPACSKAKGSPPCTISSP